MAAAEFTPAAGESPPPDRPARAALRRALDSPVRIGVVSGFVGLVAVLTLVVVSPRGVGALVHAAPPLTDRAGAPSSLPVLAQNRAFDGQFYYRLAVSPFSTANRVAGVRFDIPSLRAQRIGYPVLGWLASLGDRGHVPFALASINVIAMFALGWAGACLARAFERHAAWGLLFPLYPGFVYSLGFDLSEIVAMALLATAVLALTRRRIVPAVLLATAAVLTRETTAIFPAAVLVAALWMLRPGATREQRPVAKRYLVVGAVPLLVGGTWQLWLRQRWHALPLTASADKNISFPFSGLIDQLDKFVGRPTGAMLFRDLSLALLIVVLVAAGMSFARSRAGLPVKIGLVLAAVLLAFLSAFVWAGATSFMRAGSELYLFAVVVVLGVPAGAPTRVRFADRLLASGTVVVFGLTFVSEVGKAR